MMPEPNPRLEYTVFSCLSVGAIGLTALVHLGGKTFFTRYFGDNSPFLTVCFVSLLGFGLLHYLGSQKRFFIYRKKDAKGLVYSLGLAVILAVIISLVDYLVVLFPSDINVLLPWSLVFYPAIGFVVEIIFHVLPLTLLMFVLDVVFGKVDERGVMLCLLLVSLLEPVFQVILGFSAQDPLWRVVYVGGNILLINILQLRIFRRYDFVSMYSFRLVYYLFWHVIWGSLRVGMLF